MSAPWIAAAVIGGAVVTIGTQMLRHRRRRDRMYAELSASRSKVVAEYPVVLQSGLEPKLLASSFQRDRFASVSNFLADEALQHLRNEAEANLAHVERSYIPTHKQGGAVSYEAIHRHAPRCLSFYHSPAVQAWVSAVVGEAVVPTPDQDQSSLSLLCYTEPGDHIQWHYDHNFYRGRHFTVLLSLVNQGTAGASQSTYERRPIGGAVLSTPTPPNALILFEGAQVLHRATPTIAGDRRIMLSMTYCTDPRNSPVKECLRRIKDMAFFGWRALWD